MSDNNDRPKASAEELEAMLEITERNNERLLGCNQWYITSQAEDEGAGDE